MKTDETFEEWLDTYGESGIHLEGLSPEEYGQAIWATMRNQIQDLEDKLAKAVELIEEANDIFDGIREGSYAVDSFTSQPYRLFLKTLAQLGEKGEMK